MSCVKSVQRGIGNASTTSFTIEVADPNKCIVLIDGIITSSYTTAISPSEGYEYWATKDSAYAVVNAGATLSSITTTTLTFSNVKNTFGWQLIEFA